MAVCVALNVLPLRLPVVFEQERGLKQRQGRISWVCIVSKVSLLTWAGRVCSAEHRVYA